MRRARSKDSHAKTQRRKGLGKQGKEGNNMRTLFDEAQSGEQMRCQKCRALFVREEFEIFCSVCTGDFEREFVEQTRNKT